MNRSPFAIAQRSQDLSQNNMLAQRPFCSVVGRLYTRINDKREPVLEAVVNLSDELFHFLTDLFFHDPFFEH